MNCFYCGYCHQLEDGSYYCDDLDQTIDPCECNCSEENYES